MELGYWPQWLAIGLMVLPVVAWPLARAAWRKPVTAEWFGAYLGKVLGSAGWAAILYFGGFFS